MFVYLVEITLIGFSFSFFFFLLVCRGFIHLYTCILGAGISRTRMTIITTIMAVEMGENVEGLQELCCFWANGI